MAWGYEISLKYPKVVEYFEKITNDEITNVEPGFAGAIKIHIRHYKDNKGYTQPVPGLRIARDKEFKIQTQEDLPFKAGDLIMFADGKRYKIMDVEIIYEDEEQYMLVWSGFKDEVKVLTLR